MNEKAPWVRWEPEKFLNGVRGLDIVQVAVYTILLNMIYDNAGPIQNDPKRLARCCGGIKPSYFQRVLADLIRMGKIIEADGCLSNPKAEKELIKRSEWIQNLRKNSAAGGRATKIALEKQQEEGAKRGVDIDKDKDKEEVGRAAPPPQPTPKKANGAGPKDPTGKGTRIPADFKIDTDGIAWAVSKGLKEREARHLAEKFVLYYRSVPNSAKNAFAADWDARWQTWVLDKAAELGRDATRPQVNGGAYEMDPKTMTDKDWRILEQTFQLTGRWRTGLGPAPDQPGYRGPKKVINPS